MAEIEGQNRKRSVGTRRVTYGLISIFAVLLLYFGTAGFVLGFLHERGWRSPYWRTFYGPAAWLAMEWEPYNEFVWSCMRMMGVDL